jgi:hypothetical protein
MNTGQLVQLSTLLIEARTMIAGIANIMVGTFVPQRHHDCNT